jgi:hypothetical protein
VDREERLMKTQKEGGARDRGIRGWGRRDMSRIGWCRGKFQKWAELEVDQEEGGVKRTRRV